MADSKIDPKIRQLLKKTPYLVNVTIFEGRQIPAMDDSGTSDPFVKIRVSNEPY